MKPEELDSRISALDWEQTPASVKAVLSELVTKVAHLNEQYALLSSQMLPLSEQMGELETKLARQKIRKSRNRGFG